MKCPPDGRLECEFCGRKFNPASYARHQPVCQKAPPISQTGSESVQCGSLVSRMPPQLASQGVWQNSAAVHASLHNIQGAPCPLITVYIYPTWFACCTQSGDCEAPARGPGKSCRLSVGRTALAASSQGTGHEQNPGTLEKSKLVSFPAFLGISFFESKPGHVL